MPLRIPTPFVCRVLPRRIGYSAVADSHFVRRFRTTTLCRMSEAERLSAALDNIASSLAPVMPVPRLQVGSGRGARGRRRAAISRKALATASDVVASPAPVAPELAGWDDDAPVHNPALGLVEQQQARWGLRLAEDRKLRYLREARSKHLQVLEAKSPAAQEKPEVDDLPLDVVQSAFAANLVDPKHEMVARRDERRRESLAVHLEQMLCDISSAPATVRRALSRSGTATIPTLRVTWVEAGEDGGPATVHFTAPASCDAALLRRRLDDAAPSISAALARRMLLGMAPALRFEPAEVEERRQVSPLPWKARKQRRQVAIGGMASWTSSMHW